MHDLSDWNRSIRRVVRQGGYAYMMSLEKCTFFQ